MSTSLARVLAALTTTLALSCGGKTTTPPGPGGGGGSGTPGAVEVAVASVNLAEDCPSGRGPDWSLPAPADDAAADSGPADLTVEEAPAAKIKPGSMQEPSSASMRRSSYGDAACEQSYIQLQVTGTSGTSKFAIRKIELIDDAGRVLGELTARTPTRWQDDHYEPWSETVEAGTTTSAAYELSAPDWAKYGMTLHDAQGRVFNVRLTVAAGADERTVEQTAAISGPVVLPPGAVT